MKMAPGFGPADDLVMHGDAVTATHYRDVSIAVRYSLAFHFAYGNVVVVMVVADHC